MFSDPNQNVARFGLKEGARVVEFGAGSGAYTIALGRQVGHTGRVYAVEVQKDLVEKLDREMRKAGLGNVKVVWGDVDKLGGSKLADNLADGVLLANILFQSDQKYTMALEAKRLLQPGGRAVVIDWQDSFSNLGPPAARVARPAEVQQIFQQAGFTFLENFPAGEHHYGMIFIKPLTLKQ